MSSTTLTNPGSTTTTAYGKLRYVAADHTPTPSPLPFKMPDESEFKDHRIVPLHDVRPLPTLDQLATAKEGTAQLFTHGFTAVKHPSIMNSAPYTYASWHDPKILQEIYVPEMEEMLKRMIGAQTIITQTVVLRNNPKNGQDALPANNSHGQKDQSNEAQAKATKEDQKPIVFSQSGTSSLSPSLPFFNGFSANAGVIPVSRIVHNDFAPAGARTHIRLFHPAITAACAPIIAAEDRLLAAGLPLATLYSTSPSAPRWAFYSVWRPLKPVKRDPLVCGDMRSFAGEDHVTVDVTTPTLGSGREKKETHLTKAYVGRGSEKHRWCYVSEQKPDEVVVLRFWDSDREGDTDGAGALHTSVEIKGCEGEEPRESLELRCLAIW